MAKTARRTRLYTPGFRLPCRVVLWSRALCDGSAQYRRALSYLSNCSTYQRVVPPFVGRLPYHEQSAETYHTAVSKDETCFRKALQQDEVFSDLPLFLEIRNLPVIEIERKHATDTTPPGERHFFKVPCVGSPHALAVPRTCRSVRSPPWL